MAGLSMGGGQTASVGGRGGTIPGTAPAAPPTALDLKTLYSGAMADPAEFNRSLNFCFSEAFGLL